MWGNKNGWIMSALIVLITMGFLFLINKADAISPPTKFGKDEANLAPLSLPVSPGTVVPMNESSDAGQNYRDVIADYKANKKIYDRSTKADEIAAQKGMAALLDATHDQKMTLFSTSPYVEDIVGYGGDDSALLALDTVGKAAVNKVGLTFQKDKNWAEARRYYEATFALGAKLFNERVTYKELDIGTTLMGLAGDALAGLGKASEDAQLQKAATDFRIAQKEYYDKRLKMMAGIINVIDEGVIAEHAGDYFVFAESSKERMWRVEATLLLGRMRYNVGGDAGRKGNQLGASRWLRKLQDDPDPIIQLAAKKGLELDDKTYRQLGR